MTSIFENPDSNLFFTPIQALLASISLSSALDETAAHLVAAATTSSHLLIYINVEARRDWDGVGERAIMGTISASASSQPRC